ncbi:MAG: pyridoxal-phosphate dependent enzyme [Gemmatimonadaceae bacterium]
MADRPVGAGVGAQAPLLRRLPGLATLPRANLGNYPTTVNRIALHDGRALLIKRDDRSGKLVGGNKVRGLEWLLGGLRPGDHVLTVGPRGSTHALTTAIYARDMGARVTVVRWSQEMNPAARRVDAHLRAAARIVDAPWGGALAAHAIAAALRIRGARGARWIPAGGATPLAVLGHVNAGLELAEQIAAGECELPERLVVPLGTGSTAAGLALGIRLAGLGTQVVAVRVVPRIVGRARRVLSLANRAASLIESVTGERVPRVGSANVRVEHAFYGGGYGRPLDLVAEDESALDAWGIRLDDTYGRKAFAAAAAQRDHLTMLWLTFDSRLLDEADSGSLSAVAK